MTNSAHGLELVEYALWLGQDIADFKVDLPVRAAAHRTILLKVSS